MTLKTKTKTVLKHCCELETIFRRIYKMTAFRMNFRKMVRTMNKFENFAIPKVNTRTAAR